MSYDVYCPECLKKGKKKKLARVDDNAKGVIYLWCKQDKKEIEINLNTLSHEPTKSH